MIDSYKDATAQLGWFTERSANRERWNGVRHLLDSHNIPSRRVDLVEIFQVLSDIGRRVIRYAQGC